MLSGLHRSGLEAKKLCHMPSQRLMTCRPVSKSCESWPQESQVGPTLALPFKQCLTGFAACRKGRSLADVAMFAAFRLRGCRPYWQRCCKLPQLQKRCSAWHDLIGLPRQMSHPSFLAMHLQRSLAGGEAMDVFMRLFGLCTLEKADNSEKDASDM